MTWIRYYFTTSSEDVRPVTFPPPGPYWCTGQRGSDGASTMLAYLPPEDSLHAYWPEAADVESDAVETITFTPRFPKPSWWDVEETHG